MKTKHTPGPWWVDDDGFVASRFGDDYETVADPFGNEANAKLIAAAPELLFQVQQTKTILEVIDPENPAIDQLDMIIKKATE